MDFFNFLNIVISGSCKLTFALNLYLMLGKKKLLFFEDFGGIYHGHLPNFKSNICWIKLWIKLG